MNYWSTVPDAKMPILNTWEFIMKPGILRLAKDCQREVYAEHFGSLQVLFIKLGFFSSELQQGDLSALPNLCLAQLEIENHYKLESEKIFIQNRTFQTTSSKKS